MTDVVMPRLSDTMQEGTILRWLSHDGDTVARGDELVEIETDKASMVYESDLAGTLEILASEGETLAVGEVIAHIGPDGATPAAQGGAHRGSAAEHRDEEEGLRSAPPPRSEANVAGGAPMAPVPGEAGGRVKASPLARRVARERGVDLGAVAGSGPGGRIVRSDVEGGPATPPPAAATPPPAAATPPPAAVPPHAAPSATPPPATPPPHAAPSATPPPATPPPHAAPSATPPPPTPPPHAAPPTAATRPAPAAQDAAAPDVVATAKGEMTEIELTRTQQTIARRMAESKATIPDFSLQVEVDMEACVALREELVRMARSGDGVEAPGAPTYNDMVVKACALALREQPRVNSSYRDGRAQLHGRVNVGVAVATPDALVVPTVFDADAKALGEIARETHALVERVRSGEITPPELGGGTFTVSNLGMLGVASFTAVVNPPQAAILTVGALERRAVVDSDGAVVARRSLTLTLVCDHRLLYGADAARFAGRVRELLQAPAALTL